MSATSALIVPVELPRRHELVRRARVAVAALGVPAHVTLLFPFKPPDELRQPDHRRIASILEAHGAFAFQLTRVRDWETVRYLEVEPREPFTRLVGRLVAAYPTWVPYEGSVPYVPHVTLSEGSPGEHPPIGDPPAPLRRRADRAVLIVRDEAGRWRPHWRFRLGREVDPGH